MKHAQLSSGRPKTDELSFPPPYSEQSRYLILADQFLGGDQQREKQTAPIAEYRRKSKPKKTA
ncbi:MAG TPA: hypothetical protein VFB00_02935 [Terriglobales bacterium]|nr:hypothetical protein [Terriglobales bacterium]